MSRLRRVAGVTAEAGGCPCQFVCGKEPVAKTLAGWLVGKSGSEDCPSEEHVALAALSLPHLSSTSLRVVDSLPANYCPRKSITAKTDSTSRQNLSKRSAHAPPPSLPPYHFTFLLYNRRLPS
ncbi:hypothetical protein MIND_01113800 [Mycena indigotica]|uniref:Uncharacterized protein n=1 Tax=Mycena indigotica TaxID=2126181 RepID=A0A8H6S725_9AGAR|nr:uncharacterized protein MIND_01113800 [Mycena indigotica]KAF7293370.1 hypothetical protein MIND_01113800 [Mycena indigotica]